MMKLLRIYTNEAAYFGDRMLYKVVAERARSEGLAGVTVLEALLGFGRGSHVHTRHVLDDDRSLVIEIVDDDQKLRAFIGTLADLPEIGLITMEAVEILSTGSGPV